jgi:hypothetical protein
VSLESLSLFSGYDLIRYVLGLSQVDECVAWLRIEDEGLDLPLPLASKSTPFEQLLINCAGQEVLYRGTGFSISLGFNSPHVSMKRKAQLTELIGRLFAQEFTLRGLSQDVLPFYQPEKVSGADLQLFASRAIASGYGVLVGRRGDDQREFLAFLFRLTGLPHSEYKDSLSGTESLIVEYGSGELIFVPEIALLEEDQQRYMLDKLANNKMCIAQTSYQLDPLMEQGLLVAELHAKLKENQLIFSLGLFLPTPRELVAGSHDSEDSISVFDIGAALEGGLKVRDIVREMEMRAIKTAYSIGGGSQMKVAAMLGISRGSLQHKFKKYNLPYGDWK